jgi:hypothetical protein
LLEMIMVIPNLSRCFRKSKTKQRVNREPRNNPWGNGIRNQFSSCCLSIKPEMQQIYSKITVLRCFVWNAYWQA